MLISGTVSLSLSIAVLVVKTDRISLELVYVLGCLWAAMDGVWQTQLSGKYLGDIKVGIFVFVAVDKHNLKV